MNNHAPYINEIKERIIRRLQTEFSKDGDLVQTIIEDHFEKLVLRMNDTKDVKTKEEIKSKEEILYNNISKRGGFHDISFEEFKRWTKEGTVDVRRGLESSFAAMEEYKNQFTSCQSQGGFTEEQITGFVEWEQKQFYQRDNGAWYELATEIKVCDTTPELLQLYLKDKKYVILKK